MALFVSAIILAAGQGKRMGAQKLLLPLAGRTMIERVVDAALASRVGEVITVLGYRAEETAQVLAGKPVRLVVNPDYARGQSTSLIAGVRAARPEAAALMFILADQPFLTPDLINRLIEVYQTSACLITRPVFKDRPGHPVLLDASLIPELVTLEGDTGAREIVARYRDRVKLVPVTDEVVLLDIDTQADYLKIRQACPVSEE
ncbi:MAG: molybdenum cofactor cytidylyltransferase [Armatimonadetes bacterium]|nr:molybdenum cofactor cytidylyltransferase [Armatimonadota bacterium]